jgi:hypothetical protein
MNLRPLLVCALPVVCLGCTTYEYFAVPQGSGSGSDAGVDFPDASSGPGACPTGQWCSVGAGLTPSDLVAGWASPTEALTWIVSEFGTIYRYDGVAWSTAYQPDQEVTGSSLWATSKLDAWVSVIDGHGEVGVPLVSRFVHWDGASWSMASGSYPVFVRVVWGSAPDDYWAAGFSTSGSNAPNAILHYDGTGWTSVPIPDFPIALDTVGTDAELVDMSGSSRSDAWVMSRAGGLAHWDGSSWTLADLGPATPADTDVVSGVGIWANAANDVWYARRRGPSQSDNQSIEFVHYDGTGWQAPVSPQGAEGCLDLGLGNTYAPGSAGTLGRGVSGSAGGIVMGDPFDSCTWAYAGGAWSGQSFGAEGTPFRTFALGTEGDSFGLGAAGTVGPISPGGYASAASEPTANDAYISPNQQVSATRDDDVWALGADPTLPVPRVPGPSFVAGLTAVRHWDGTQLTTMTPLGGVGALTGLSAISPTSVWAVGCRFVQDAADPSKIPGAIALHFDETGWHESLVASGPTPCIDPALFAVWATGTDAYAAGADGLVAHWDGARWATLQGPVVAGETLTVVTGSATNDVFFVGTSPYGQLTQPTVLHWNGVALAALTVPAQGLAGNVIAAFADAPSSLWVAVNWAQVNTGDDETLSHWDGTAWTTVDIPASMFTSAIAGSSGQLFVAGMLATSYEQDLEGNALDSGVLFTFDGASWTRQPLLADIPAITSATVSGGALWVVGDHALFAQHAIGPGITP